MGFVSSAIEVPAFRRGRTRWLALALLATLVSAAEAGACRPPVVAQGRVAGLAGGSDLRLADGRVVRLAAIATDFGREDHAAALHTALAELALGQEVEIASGASLPDRYGRLAGLVRIKGAAADDTLQAGLVELGLAVVRPEEGFESCAAALAPVEDPARASRLGLWAVLPVDAASPAAVRRLKGRFAVIEGRIFAARSGRNSDYLNFGRIWRKDVTVRIPRSDHRRFIEAGLAPESLGERRIVARGVIFEAGGPMLEARLPEQIRLEGK